MRLTVWRAASGIFLASVLAACGGGGQPQTPPPNADAPSVTNGGTSGGTGEGSGGGDSSGTPVVMDSGSCDVTRSSATTATFSSTHPRVFVNQAATLSCLQQLLAAGSPSATRFKALVDNEVSAQSNPSYTWNNPKNYLFQYWFAALMYKVTGQGSYGDFAVARIDQMVASEEALMAAGANPVVAGDSFLDIGRLVGDVALVYDWCHDKLTPGQRARWINYMNQSIYNVWNPSTAAWGGTFNASTHTWSGARAVPGNGWAINDPYNNYYYSFLRATMLAGLATRSENSMAQTWIDQFRTAKVGNQLLPAFNTALVGGGSQEGTGYGTAMKGLFQLYDWWERSTGERIATLTPHTLQSVAWMTHNIVPTLDFIAATGDQSRDSTAALFDYHREYLLSLISLFPEERLSSVAKGVLDASSVPTVQYAFESFADYLYHPPVLPSASVTDLSTTYWGAGTGQLLMRSAWGDRTAAFSEFSCGPLTQGHAHRDQGAFQIYRGEWLAPTGNIYTHSGIQAGESLNNLVRFQNASGNPIPQVNYTSNVCTLGALADTALYTYARAIVTPIYNGHTAIQKVEREYLFVKPGTFVVFDRAASTAGTRRIWTLNVPGIPTVSGDHLIYTGAKADRMDVFRVAPTGLAYQVNTPSLDAGDTLLAYGATAKRVDVVDTSGTQSNFLHVIGTSLNSTAGVSAVTRSDATGQTGIRFTLPDGRVVTARFFNSDPTVGNSLDIRTSTGTVQVTGNLPTTVTAPPLFAH